MKNIIDVLKENAGSEELLKMVVKANGNYVRFTSNPYQIARKDFWVDVYAVFYEKGDLIFLYVLRDGSKMEGVYERDIKPLISVADYDSLSGYICRIVCGGVDVESMIHHWVVENDSIDYLIGMFPQDKLKEWVNDKRAMELLEKIIAKFQKKDE